ncbi:AhpA/YtjB family protein [Corallincola platygyrae]|uniref:AhpA/YtjB family protein n=1 Tax=Corallincola platygyrae TaxID=1193278 RepID=A0ABW4XS10_9GAMM
MSNTADVAPESSSTSTESSDKTKPSGLKSNTRYIYWRLFFIAMTVALVLVIMQLMVTMSVRTNALIQQQTEVMSRMLTHQAALEAVKLLIEQDQERLHAMAEHLASDPYILDASIYDVEGIALARSTNALDITALLGFGDVDEASRPKRDLKPYIAEVVHENETLGYIRITLEMERLLDQASQVQQTSYDQGRILLLLTGLTGFMLAQVLKRRH